MPILMIWYILHSITNYNALRFPTGQEHSCYETFLSKFTSDKQIKSYLVNTDEPGY